MATQAIELDPAPHKPIFQKNSTRLRKRQRIETAFRSFRVLKNLSPDQVERFMKSYVIYNLDWADEHTMIETLGPEYQKKVGECLADYYCVLNHMCAIGDLEKMYIPPVMDLHGNLSTNQLLYEESIAAELDLPKHSSVLELGCGRGQVAAHMTSMTGALVTGLNIDSDQIARATVLNKEKKLSNHFICADFNELPLPFKDAQFDGFYQIQAFSLAKDIPLLCRELYRVLKPGAKLSLLDWAALDAYDPKDPHHQELMRRIKPLIGAVGTPSPASLAADLSSAGFNVLRLNNASIDGLQSPLIEKADGYFRTTRFALLGLVRLGLLPKHFKTLFNRFTQDCDAFIEADRAGLITTSYHWLAEKPLLNSTADAKITSSASSETAVETSSSLGTHLGAKARAAPASERSSTEKSSSTEVTS